MQIRLYVEMSQLGLEQLRRAYGRVDMRGNS